MTIFFFFTFLLIPLIRSGCSFFTSIVIQLWIIEKDKTIGPLKKHSRWSYKSGSTEWILKASCGSSSWLCDHFSCEQQMLLMLKIISVLFNYQERKKSFLFLIFRFHYFNLKIYFSMIKYIKYSIWNFYSLKLIIPTFLI